MEISNRKLQPKKSFKNWVWSVLGSIWEGFGTLWALFWTLLATLGSFFWRSKPNFYEAWVQDKLQEAFWVDFGLILGRFRESWGRFGRVLGGFGLSKMKLLCHMVVS